MSGGADHPLVVLACAVGLAGAFWLCHSIQKAFYRNKIYRIDDDMKGDKELYSGIGVWPFKDKYQMKFLQRFIIEVIVFGLKWIFAFSFVLTGYVLIVSTLSRLVQ